MKKMCKYWDRGRECMLQVKCPKNTGPECEIITKPKKPKEKWVKVKAWAMFLMDGDLAFASRRKNMFFECRPCYILARRKDLDKPRKEK